MARDGRQISTVGVVGLGTMGAGIAEVFARAGLAVTGYEPEQAALERGIGHLRRSTDRAVGRGRMSAQDQGALLGRVALTTELSALTDVDLVIEAVPERLDVKRDLFARLDEVCRPRTILATNTSSLSVTALAAATGRPDRLLGMHFFNPAPVLRLVEVVRTIASDDAVVEDVRALAERLGKSPVVVADRAGFVANALLFGYLNQAIGMVETGHATRDDIDAAMTLGAGLPMGPFRLLDLIGLDTSYEILARMHGQTGSRRHAPAPLLEQLVALGRLGRKAGHGFYGPDEQHSPGPAEQATGEAELRAQLGGCGVPYAVHGSVVELTRSDDAAYGAVASAREACLQHGWTAVLRSDRAGGIVDALLHPYLSDAVRMVEDGYASRSDVDTAMTQGCGYPAGPFELLDRIGPRSVVDALEAMYAETREPHLAPARTLVRAAGQG